MSGDGTFRTYPAAPGRLFPPQHWDTGWTLSLQADLAGYVCAPRLRLDRLEDYERVEAMITGPFPHPVDPGTLDLPEAVLARFTALEPGGGPAIGQGLSWAEVDALRAALDRAGLNPNAGVPRGRIGWSGQEVYHGTDPGSAWDILENGVLMDASHKGYLGQAFYVAEEAGLARSNYAEASEDGEGVVLVATIREGARILDLRNAEDAKIWTRLGLAQRVGEDGFARIARRLGVDGVYDRSVGGLAIYDPNALEGVRVCGVTPGPANDAPEGP
jgi:hypothetical protein